MGDKLFLGAGDRIWSIKYFLGALIKSERQTTRRSKKEAGLRLQTAASTLLYLSLSGDKNFPINMYNLRGTIRKGYLK